MASFGLGQLSLENGAQPQNTQEIDSSTPWMAASEGNLPLLQASLSVLNLPVTIADENGYTLLHAASAYSRLQVMEWLFSKGVDVNAVDSDGDSALHHSEDVKVSKVLIEQGHANPLVANSEGKIALQVKQDDLEELLHDEDEKESEDASKLRELIAYLLSISIAQ